MKPLHLAKQLLTKVSEYDVCNHWFLQHLKPIFGVKQTIKAN